jgi:hypothetical protein
MQGTDPPDIRSKDMFLDMEFSEKVAVSHSVKSLSLVLKVGTYS